MKVSKYEFIRSPFVTREDTRALKGYAILIMLFLHLFNNKEVDCNLNVWFYIDGIPLCYWLTKFAAVCVYLYMFLSGYGLYIVYKSYSKMHNVRRVMVLWGNVVLVAILFYPWSLAYPHLNWTFDVIGVISTLSGFHPYNGTWWFLFPWMLICLCSKKIMDILDKCRKVKRILVVACVYFLLRLSIYLSGGSDQWFNGPMRFLYEIEVAIILLLPFLLGAASAKYGILKYFKVKGQDSLLIRFLMIMSLLFLICIRMFFIHKGYFDAFIAMAFFCVLLTFSKYANNYFLRKLGEESTNMWLIHTFFCDYFCHDFIYSFKYPILIYIVLTLISYVAARIITFIYKPIQKSLFRNK